MSNDPFGPMDTMWGVADSLSNMTSSAMNKRLLTRQIGAKLAKGQKDKAENEALGPCIVNVGSPRINRVRIEPPQNKPTNSGTSYTHYTMTLFNKGGILLIEFVGEIGICDYREPYEMNSVTEMVNFTEPDLKRRKGYRHIETFEKSIDGREGAITIGQGSGTIPDIVSFQYIIDRLTRVNGYLLVPYNKGAMEILDSVRVELKEKRAYNGSAATEDKNLSTQSSATKSSSDPAQKLKQLKEMLDEGLITKSEFESKRQEIISRM